MSSPTRYPRAVVVLHWILAPLIIALLVTGWYMVGIPTNTAERAFFFNLHKSLGIVTAIFIVALIVWRVRNEAPPLPSTMPRWEKLAAILNHGLFYVFMLVVTLSGYLTSSFSRFGPKFFGIPLPHWGWEDAQTLLRCLRPYLLSRPIRSNIEHHRLPKWLYLELRKAAFLVWIQLRKCE